MFTAIVAPANEMLPGFVVVSVPPHTVVEEFATVMLAGRVSLNATPVSATEFPAGFVIVKVSDEVAFNAISDPLKAFAMEGGPTTATLAEAVPPVPPSVEDTGPVVLFFAPALWPVTFTEKLHEALAAKDAPLRLTVPDPAVAVIVPPPQDPVSPFGVETARPGGKLSVNAIVVRAVVALGFVTVNVRDVEPLSGILAAPNAFARVGGVTTVSVALEVFPVPPSVEVT